MRVESMQQHRRVRPEGSTVEVACTTMMTMLPRVVAFNDFRNNFKQPHSWLKSFSMKSHHRLEDERVHDVHLLEEIVVVVRLVEKVRVVGVVTGRCVVVVNKYSVGVGGDGGGG